MATAQLTAAVRHLRRALMIRDGAGMTDGQLLECFLARRDEAAFEALVRRHGPMVLGVCRRVLRSSQDAEDAFQATLLVLVRKAASIVPREMVGNWLHGVAYRTSLKAKAVAAKRRLMEKQVDQMPEPEVLDGEVPYDLVRLLDQELSRLPEIYRAPLLMCELEGRSRSEAARQLRLPEGTISSRLARARGMLAKRLARRGVALSIGILTTALSHQAASASVPTQLLTTTVQAATQLATHHAIAAGLVSAKVAALTEGVLKTMLLAKLKIASVFILAVALVGGLFGVIGYPALATEDGKEKLRLEQVAQTKETKKPQGPSVHGAVKSVDPAKNTITINTTEVVNGKKQSDEKTFDLAKDLKVFLDDRLSKEQPALEGKLADLTPGTAVTVQLGEDKKSATAISARGPGLHGHVKAVDPSKNSITFGVKESGGIVDKTVELAKDAKVLLNDGLKKGDKDQEGKLADLTEGTPVLVQLSVDRKTALGVRVLGNSVNGTVKGVDIGSNTITVTVKEEAQVVDKTFNMVKDIQVDGKALAELTEGTRVVLRLSVFDKMKAVGIHVPKEGGEQEEN